VTNGLFSLTLAVVAGMTVMVGGALGVREIRRHESTAEAAPDTEDNRDFANPSSVEAGMGPGYNGISCGSCHSFPAVGGAGVAPTLRVARRGDDGTVRAYPGPAVVHTFSTPYHECQPAIPADANVFSRRLPLSTFGSGLIDAIPDQDLIALEDPHDADRDGISGRAARVFDRASATRRVGRFGWKAQQASLLAFAADAYAHEMGVTNDLYPEDYVFGLSAEQLRRCDSIKDPEDVREKDGTRAIDKFTAFMRSLPAPGGGAVDPAGARLFEETGCASCHRPQVGAARAYSDFLLHEIGTGDGIPEGDASADEIRTAPLWGIGTRLMYLHDGSAATIDEAIARHDREAAGARARFNRLGAPDRRQLVAFVKSR
jgi:CxxC motif-containing protein (DUF1111 family)